MADYAENVQRDSDSDEDNGRSGPGLFSLSKDHFLPHLQPSGEIGGRRVPAAITRLRERSPGTVATVGRLSPVPKLEDPAPVAPMADIQMADAPPLIEPVNAPAPAPALAPALPVHPQALAQANLPAADEHAGDEPAAAGLIKVNDDDDDDDDDVAIIPAGREILDPRGDILLVAGTDDNIREFRVCSRALFRHSPELERICREDVDARYRFRSHTPDSDRGREEPRRIQLEAYVTNMKALHLLLILVHHGPNDRVYAMLKGPKLFSDVLVIAHHFEMVTCMSGVAPRWLKDVYKKDVARFDEVSHQLWICHMVGHLPCVKQTLLRMITTARLNSQGELLGFGAHEDQPFSTFAPLKALKLLDEITDCRRAVMEKLFTYVDNAIKILTTTPEKSGIRPNGGYLCRAINVGAGVSEQRRCDALLLGNLMRELSKYGWHKKDERCSPFSHHGSPSILHKRIASIAKRAVEKGRPDDWNEATDPHIHCLPFGDVWPSLDDLINAEIEKMKFDKEEFSKSARALGFKNLNWD